MDVHIFTGHRGSGKTEIAVNFAIRQTSAQLNGRPPAVVLLDIDVVNPYFAAREARAVLEAHGVTVAAPSLTTTTAALPVLSGEITRCLWRNTAQRHHVQTVVIDAGGDPAGARILRTLRRYLHGNPLSVYCVVNTKRPSTSGCQGIIEYIDAIAAAAQLPMTGLIHNTHLLDETSIEDILQGQRLLRQVSAMTKLPIVLTTVMKRLAGNVQAIDNDVFTLEQYIKPPYS
jgi:hypothetical protein